MSNENTGKTYFDIIEERFSCRSFTDESVSTQEIQRILEAARIAPSAVNFQPVRIYVVENSEILKRLTDATRFTFGAKTIFVICYDTEQSWHRRSDNKDHGEIDATIATTQMMLAATALGIGSCYVCSFKEALLREILDIPSTYNVSALLPIGYPKEVLPHGSRKELEEFVIYK